MSFMQPQVTERTLWIEIDGPCGITAIPFDLVFRGTRAEFEDLDDDARAELVADYYESSTVWRIDVVEGHGARMSAPGYLDCTEWCVFQSVEEAEEYLKDFYGDEEETEEGAE